MNSPKNKQQTDMDAIVRAARERRSLIETALRGTMAPESLSFEEIRRVCEFAIVHAENRSA